MRADQAPARLGAAPGLCCAPRWTGWSRCWRPSSRRPAWRPAAGAALNRARREARPWCSTSSPTRSTPGSMPRSPGGYYRDAGVDLHVQQPSASTDAPKLLEAGRAQFAILDIHDLAIARERGLDLVGVTPIVQRPLAAVIAAGPNGDPHAERPRRQDGRRHGAALGRRSPGLGARRRWLAIPRACTG